MVESQWLWLAGAGGVVVGVVLGVVLARRGHGPGQTERIRDLEDQLEIARSDHARYKSDVSAHFEETSHRLRDLTLQYKAVYEHLADGARRLSPEGAVELAPSLAEAALPAAAGATAAAAVEPAADESQLDLDLDERWAVHTGHLDEPREAAPEPLDDASLGPILDEEAPPPEQPREARST